MILGVVLVDHILFNHGEMSHATYIPPITTPCGIMEGMTIYKSDLTANLEPTEIKRHHLAVANTVMRAQARFGIIPPSAADHLPQVVADQRTQHWTAEYKHETAGWVKAWREVLPDKALPYSYLGLTSSNLIDCSFAIATTEVNRRISSHISNQVGTMNKVLQTTDGWIREGRTHGQIAAPVIVKSTYLRFWDHLQMSLAQLNDTSGVPGALGGPSGETHPVVLPVKIAAAVAEDLGIEIDTEPTQIADRLQWLDWAYALYRIIACCEQLATYHRLESINGVDRFQEKFAQGVQKGSSSMPHKVNPIRSERICGLARVARGHLMALSETATTGWWERDLSNSSVEKTALVDLAHLAGFCLTETFEILDGMVLQAPEKLDRRSLSHHWMVEAQLEGKDPDTAYRQIQQELS